MSESKPEKPEAPDLDLFKNAVELVSRKDRRIVVVVVTLVGLVVGAFTMFVSLNSRGEAFVDNRIDIKVKPLVDDHEKRLSLVERNAQETHDSVLRVETMMRLRQTSLDEGGGK